MIVYVFRSGRWAPPASSRISLVELRAWQSPSNVTTFAFQWLLAMQSGDEVEEDEGSRAEAKKQNATWEENWGSNEEDENRLASITTRNIHSFIHTY